MRAPWCSVCDAWKLGHGQQSAASLERAAWQWLWLLWRHAALGGGRAGQGNSLAVLMLVYVLVYVLFACLCLQFNRIHIQQDSTALPPAAGEEQRAL